MTKVISVVNQKGGVGKTTTCVNLGAALAQKSFKVLLVDLDPMGSLSGWLMDEESGNGTGTGDLLRGTIGFLEAIKKSEALNLDFIPAGKHLSEIVLLENIDPFILGERLGNWVEKYDFVIIDCAPSANVLIANALLASDSIIIPIQTETLPLKSGIKFLQWLGEFKAEYNTSVNILGILPCMFDSRTRLSLQILESMKNSEHLGPLVFDTVIRKNIRLAEAPGMRRSIFRSASRSFGANDYNNLAIEVAYRLGINIPEESAAISDTSLATDEVVLQEPARVFIEETIESPQPQNTELRS
jgi:chromosome partitioning protein